MKLLVFPPFCSPHIGGVESYLEELHKQLSERGVEIVVFAPRLPRTAAVTDTRGSTHTIRYPACELIPHYPLPMFWRWEFWQLYRKLPHRSADIVVSHTRFFCTSLLALFHARCISRPLLHIEHGSRFVSTANPLVSFAARLADYTLGRVILTRAHTVVAVSEAVASFVKTRAPRARCQVIRRGFDPALLETPPVLPLPHPRPLLLFIGRLVSGKGAADLVTALACIIQTPWHALIVGNGPEQGALKRLAERLGLSSRISFVGAKSHDEALALLKAADILINPSYSEGLPTTVAEAALAGKAVVATAVGGTREVLAARSHPFLVPPGDPIILAERILLLIENTVLREQVGAANREKMLHDFSPRAAGDTFLRLLRELTIS